MRKLYFLPIVGILFLRMFPLDIIKLSSYKYDTSLNKVARIEYFHRMLRDPKTNQIPSGIRQKELKFSKQLLRNKSQLDKGIKKNYEWVEAGPTDVGGRTRAICVDERNPLIIIAGGVSGGIWKTTTGGDNWNFCSLHEDIQNVTSITQDPRTDFQNNWYCTTGELVISPLGNIGTILPGSGIYKSEDNGNNWYNILKNENNLKLDSRFNFISRILVCPVTGNIYIAENFAGISRSTDGGRSFETILGDSNMPVWNDIQMDQDGNLVASISQQNSKRSDHSLSGLFRSTNHGSSWINITPESFPLEHKRTVIAISKSNPLIFYTLTDLATSSSEINNVALYHFNLSNNSYDDRSRNLPDFTSINPLGYLNTQNGYNMVIAVKPDNEDCVIVGGTNLFISYNGFSSKPLDSEIEKHWIGGYSISGTPKSFFNQHADQHAIVFNPKDYSQIWTGHDGGISFTKNIEQVPIEWISLNNGYNVTQFYTISLSPNSIDNRIVGGTQDNGSPFFTLPPFHSRESVDLSSGDGGFCFWGEKDVFVQSQSATIRLGLEANNNNPPDIFNQGGYDWDVIDPLTEDRRSFLAPFIVDSKDENIVYYATQHEIWRNKNIRNISQNISNKEPTSEGWENIAEIQLNEGYIFSALAVSEENDSNILYAGMSGNNTLFPCVFRFDNIQNSLTEKTTVYLPPGSEGGYINSIEINPENAREILICLSNYNINGTWYSQDGGDSFTSIEGNLLGDNISYGPSIRDAEIVIDENSPEYFLATSIGVFTTDQINGGYTSWIQLSDDLIGNSISSNIISRKSDNRIGVATFGRGVFIGQVNSSIADSNLAKAIHLNQNFPNPFNNSTTISLDLLENHEISLTIFNTNGAKVRSIFNGYLLEGHYEFKWDGKNNKERDVASGVYIIQLKSQQNFVCKKAILLK